MTSIFPELADLGASDEGTAAAMPSVRGTTSQRRSEITFVCGNVSNPIPEWKIARRVASAVAETSVRRPILSTLASPPVELRRQFCFRDVKMAASSADLCIPHDICREGRV